MQKSVYDAYARPFSMFGDGAGGDPAAAMQKSTHMQPTETSQRFFGRANIEELQGRLKDEIRKQMGYAIDRQSEEQLLIVMRYVFMQSSRNAGGAAEVRRLNELVLAEIVPQVGSGLSQYLGYLRDASTLPTPIARGQATSIKGTKTAEFPGFFPSDRFMTFEARR